MVALESNSFYIQFLHSPEMVAFLKNKRMNIFPNDLLLDDQVHYYIKAIKYAKFIRVILLSFN